MKKYFNKEKIMKICKAIYECLKSEMIEFHRKCSTFIFKFVRGLKWFKFSWNLFWWDGGSIEKTLAWMILDMGWKFRKHGHLEGSSVVGENMIYFAQRMKALNDGCIEDEIYKQHEMKFPNKPKDFLESVELAHGFHGYIESKSVLNYRKTKEGKREDVEFSKLHKRIQEAEKKERKALYTYLAENIDNWWD